MARPTKFSPEVKECAVRLVRGHQREYDSQYEAIRSVAETIGCHPESLRGWLRRTEVDAGARPGTTADEHTRLAALEREVKELRRANEILRKASADSIGQGNSAASAAADPVAHPPTGLPELGGALNARSRRSPAHH